MKDAPIVILDEATSSVDPENEHELIAAIGELTRGKTLVSIAHRLNTVAGADQILVVDEGRIVQRGTHDQLMGEQGLNRDFVNLRREAAGWRLAVGRAPSRAACEMSDRSRRAAVWSGTGGPFLLYRREGKRTARAAAARAERRCR